MKLTEKRNFRSMIAVGISFFCLALLPVTSQAAVTLKASSQWNELI
jgi:DMSO/TMAO reductase YedYZ heme-binding membrane subunit